MSRQNRILRRAVEAARVPVWAGLVLLVSASSTSASDAPAALQRTDLERVAVWNAPAVDVARLLEEDEYDARARVPYRVGTALEAGLSPGDSGTWQTGGEFRVWRIVLRSPGAYWLLPAFDRVNLEPGAELWLYDPDGRNRLGPFTQEHVVDGRLGLPPIDGDTLVVEIDWPADTSVAGLEAHLGRLFHGYRALNGVAASACTDDSGTCSVDVNCPLGDDWQDEKRGVVELVIPDRPPGTNVAVCSGSLINNTALDCRPYVLTADHCFTTSSDLVNTSFIFGYERPGCGPGSASQAVFGTNALFRARHPTTDFRLLEVGLSFPTEGLYFNGWSRFAAPPPEAFTIHHPMGAPKKISHTARTLVLGDGNEYPDGYWRVLSWAQGVVEPGSSGSPLFDPAGRILGQLDSGSSACEGLEPNNLGDNFGRLDVSWDIHPTIPSLRLKDWLDPTGSDVLILNGMDQSYCGNPHAKLVQMAHFVDENQGNRDGILDPGDIAQLDVRLTNSGPLGVGSEEDGVTGTLSLADPEETEVALIVDEAAWPAMSSGRIADSAPPHFTIDLDADRLCGRSIRFRIEAGSNVSTFRVGTGAPTGYVAPFEDDMELGSGSWTVSPAGTWTLTTSNSAPDGGSTSWHVSDSQSFSDARLVMPAYSSLATPPELAAFEGLPPGLEFRFEHYLNSECGTDGGVLEYSTDGVTWQDAGPWMIEGGYNSVILPGSAAVLAGRPAWSGDLGGWVLVRVDFSELEGVADLQLRWRFATDASTGVDGWYVDNVALEAPILECARPHRRLVPGAFCRGHLGAGPWPLAVCGAAPGRSSGRR